MSTMTGQMGDMTQEETIINLCQKLRRPPLQDVTSCFGVVADLSSPKARKYTVHPATQTTSERDLLTMISLHNVLDRQGGQNALTYKQRLHLAVLVAKGVLQFHKTLWLSDTPSSRDIFFIQRNSSCSYQEAFVMTKTVEFRNQPTSFPLIRSPTLLGLGVVLIELLQGNTIDSLRTPGEVLSADLRPLSDYMTTRRLLSEAYQMSSNYGSAVRRCIEGGFQRQDLNLDDEDFRYEVYYGVVALLEEDFKNS
jgi:hypothetical protein